MSGQHNEAPLSVTFKPNGDPLITVRGSNPDELNFHLQALGNGLSQAIASGQAAVNAGFAGGAQSAPQQAAPQPLLQGDPPQQYYQQAAAQGYQQQQQAAQQPPQQDQWSNSPSDAQWQQNNPPQQPQQPQADPGYQPAQPQGAPMVLGMPAKFVEGNKNGRKWRAWADPRPKEQTANISERTDNPNDPRLAQGTATFWAFIR